MSQTKIITKKEKGANRHWKNFLDKDYLGSHNLEPGEEMLLTIEKFVGEEEVKTDKGTEIKPVLYFKEDGPKMIMNITNGNTITALYGSHPDGWKGKSIQVYTAKIKAFGKEQNALRVRDFTPVRDVDTDKHKKALSTAKTLDALKKKWVALPVSAREDKTLIKYKDELKDTLTAKK